MSEERLNDIFTTEEFGLTPILLSESWSTRAQPNRKYIARIIA